MLSLPKLFLPASNLVEESSVNNLPWEFNKAKIMMDLVQLQGTQNVSRLNLMVGIGYDTKLLSTQLKKKFIICGLQT